MSGKCYFEEFKIEVVKQVVDCGYFVVSVVICFDIIIYSFYFWIKKYGLDFFINKEQLDVQVEICCFQKELKWVIDEWDILKKVVVDLIG